MAAGTTITTAPYPLAPGIEHTYHPNENFSGSDSFTYLVNDGALDSNVSNVAITITPVNDLPTVSDFSIATAEDTAVTFGFTGQDIEGDSLSFEAITQPTNGTLTLASDTGLATYTPVSYTHLTLPTNREV